MALADGATQDQASPLAEAERPIAPYKLPKAFVFVDEIIARETCWKEALVMRDEFGYNLN